MILKRRITEAEVIAEFLRNEFYQKEYDKDREEFENLVLDPDLADEAQNAIRRALLYRRRGHMWRELPKDTVWHEVEIDAEDLKRIRVFPRAHWRKISNGSFLLSEIVKRIRDSSVAKTDPAFSKIQLLRYRLQRDSVNSAVLLIGVDEEQPLTILEGNHRLAAAMLVSPRLVHTGFRVLCGLSPHMYESCWYDTNIPNLWNYLKNRLNNLVDKEADVQRVLGNGSEAAPASAFASEMAKAHKVEAK
ncbi:MAG TPA: hypothetical protein VJ453_12190 [Terriglobales bacterium]|jgi:hypothetical protein|nr:hypothetical protein [Terriglobales bacterium]